MKKSSKLAVQKNGRMLLVRRRKDGKWTLPGGKRKKFEAPQRSLLRELKEELPYVEVKSVKRWGKSIRIEGENGKKKDHQIFTARKIRGRLTIGDREEIDRAGWFKPAKVKLTGVNQKVVQRSRRSFSWPSAASSTSTRLNRLGHETFGTHVNKERRP